MRRILIPALLLLSATGCATSPAVEPKSSTAETTLLARSTPADGATVAAPVDALQMTFAKPARLIELTIDGPDGLSPMMITAAGEVQDYSVPLPGLGAGAYRANWKATAAGQTYTGTIAFTVR